jgi:hypothetical protein
MHDIALLAPGGAGGEFAAVGHYHFDGVVAGMDVLLHRLGSVGACAPKGAEFGGSIQDPDESGKPADLTDRKIAGHCPASFTQAVDPMLGGLSQ